MSDMPPTNTQNLCDRVTEALRNVIDPEIGVNIVDLGMLYDVRVDDDGLIEVDMTLTSQACPLGEVLRDQVYQAIQAIGLPAAVCVNWVWKPAWGPERITDEGKEQLRALGFHV